MMFDIPLVALDLETTGLDADKDTVLEIGAVRFRGPRVEDEFRTFVHPRRPIPPFVTRLTGINQAMVARAPVLEEVVDDLADFIGDAPVVGHNVEFDLRFLQPYGLFRDHLIIDTYELASVLLPTAERYNLAYLGRLLGVPLPATHRALEDARATQAVFLRLYERLLDLPASLIAEIIRLAWPLNWSATWVFQEALDEVQRRGGASSPQRGEDDARGALSLPYRLPEAEPSLPKGQPALDPEEVAALLEPGGLLVRHFPGYEHRSQQVEMARAVARALGEGRHLMVEAGTGTGKSLAYLLPAAVFARRHNTRVVIATHTKNLQDQLLQKDIPALRQALGLDEGELRAVVLKGRANYLCPRRLAFMRREGPRDLNELRVLAKVLVWLHQGGSGVRDELNLRGAAEAAVWSLLNADDEGCSAAVCRDRMGGACPLYQARTAAEAAHLVVVNHALLLADVLVGQRVLPDYRYLIVDEAHHLESALTNALTQHVTERDWSRLLQDLGGPRTETLGRLRVLAQELFPEDLEAFTTAVETVTDWAFQFQEQVKACFRALGRFLEDLREGRPIGPYEQQVRITDALRHHPLWNEVEIPWGDARETFAHLNRALEDVDGLLARWEAQLRLSAVDDLDAGEALDLIGRFRTIARQLNEAYRLMEGILLEPNPDLVYWVSLRPTGRWLALHAAPLHVGPMMREHIWYAKNAVVLTSATLSVAGDFDYLRQRLFAEDVDELALGSPFDYENAALLYLVNDIPEPNQHAAYQRAVEQGLIHLARATGGRLMALFTSYAQLERTARAIAPVLAEDEIVVFAQGSGASPRMLLDSFRVAERAVLLGTRAFWEGVDLPGEDLQALVIVRLPFAVPSDPLVAARSETFDDPFYQFQVPEAILTFRQGFGRLIRTRSDRGIVAVFDRRVLSKRYGRLFLEALPPCKVHQGSLRDLPRVAARWLGA